MRQINCYFIDVYVISNGSHLYINYIWFVKEIEKLGFNDDVLATVWLAISRYRRIGKNEDNAAQVDEDNAAQVATIVPKASLTAGSLSTQLSIPVDKDRQTNDIFKVPRAYMSKRRLSLPKEYGFKNCWKTI